MAVDNSKIFARACSLYIKDRGQTPGTETTHATNEGWVDVGSLKANTAKLVYTPKTIQTQHGKTQIGGDSELTVEALEVNEAKITALEAFKGKIVDIIAKPVSTTETRCYKILAHTLVIGASDDFGGDEPSTLPLSGSSGGLNSIHDSRKEITLDWSL